jgi:hypothetical protein
MQKEANFMKSVETYISTHGRDHLFDAVAPKSKRHIVPATVELTPIRNADVEEYTQKVERVIKEYPHLSRHISPELLYRYHVWGMLSNISLSVDPDLKRKWGITHELFGSAYNTLPTVTYGSLFPDLEENSTGNVFFFKPKKGQIILANPPYTAEYIRWTCRKIIDDWKGKATFYVVIPVWDRKTRDELGLKRYPDIPEISELIAASTHHEVVHKFPFYDGIHGKKVHLRDPVHVVYLNSAV